MTYKISPEGLALIAQYEGFRAEPQQLPDGNWVVGHGHVRAGAPGAALSESDARQLLALDVAPAERVVTETVTVALTQSQFDALVSFAFSLGAEAFAKSQVLRRVNAGEFIAAAYAMEAWRKAEVDGELLVVGALVRRRAAEKALFLRDLPHDAAPSAFMRAKLDHAASVLGAPVKLAPALATGIVQAPPACAPQKDIGAALTEILRSEPATEALLLSTPIVDECVDEDLEISTANAKPVARPAEDPRPALERAVRRFAADPEALPWLKRKAVDLDALRVFEGFGAVALFVLGVVLVLVGGSILMSPSAGALALFGASVLTVPGLVASGVAGVALARSIRSHG